MTHRFVNADKIVAGIASDTSGYNLFEYCNSNPINFVDYSGYWPMKDGVNALVETIRAVRPFPDHSWGIGISISGMAEIGMSGGVVFMIDSNLNMDLQLAYGTYIGVGEGFSVDANYVEFPRLAVEDTRGFYTNLGVGVGELLHGKFDLLSSGEGNSLKVAGYSVGLGGGVGIETHGGMGNAVPIWSNGKWIWR